LFPSGVESKSPLTLSKGPETTGFSIPGSSAPAEPKPSQEEQKKPAFTFAGSAPS